MLSAHGPFGLAAYLVGKSSQRLMRTELVRRR
jgi:hypothetical protein